MAHGRKVGYTQRTDDKWQALLLIFHNNRRDQQLPWWSNTRTNSLLPSRRGLPISTPPWGSESIPVPGFLVKLSVPIFAWVILGEPHTAALLVRVLPLNNFYFVNKNKSLNLSAYPVLPKQSELTRVVVRTCWKPISWGGRKDYRSSQPKAANGDNGTEVANRQAGPFLHPFVLAMERQNETCFCLWDYLKFQSLKPGIMGVFPARSVEVIQFWLESSMRKAMSSFSIFQVEPCQIAICAFLTYKSGKIVWFNPVLCVATVLGVENIKRDKTQSNLRRLSQEDPTKNWLQRGDAMRKMYRGK